MLKHLHIYSMDKEKLILSVQQHPCLFDLQHPQYDNNLYKENVWKEISNDVQSPIEDCKTRWALLRTYYRRAIQRRRTTSGKASKKARKWRFEEQMQFLKTHLEERETASNLTINEEEQESELLSVETEETESTPPVPSPATSLSPAPAAIPQQLVTSKKSKNLPTSKLANVLSTFIEKRNIDKPPKKETPEEMKKKSLMIFFESISDSMVKFNELDCAEIKHQIFNIVSQKEREILRSNQLNESAQYPAPGFYPAAAGSSYQYGYPGYSGSYPTDDPTGSNIN
ncbi:hypothetical protein LSTR_LSTR015649 [Laodelphax striatellus]|uniref:MADF domain-containing protein n=1 Tax=Laodelphax striatellus TaxID=195883 RepID=A0A482WWA0_LAOST|nr:hypothetical protein LSTR_LSTR015649 [Laodelphax striatellus]